MRLQSQRQLQLSLEAHARYISTLIEREGLHGKLENPDTRAALATLCMVPPAQPAAALPQLAPSDAPAATWQDPSAMLPHMLQEPAQDAAFLLSEDAGVTDGQLGNLLLDSDLQARYPCRAQCTMDTCL